MGVLVLVMWLMLAIMVALGVGLYIPLAKRYGWVAQVVARSSHQRVTAVGAGVVMMLTLLPFVVWLVLQGVLATYWLWFAGVAMTLSILGWMDDRIAQPVWLRLLVQSLALLVWVLAAAHSGQGVLSGDLGAWMFVTGVVLLVAQAWFVNLFNFMDGLDGFAAIEALFVFASMCWLAGSFADLTVVYAISAAAVAGLLVWNLPPAKVFMGDAGSLLLGFWLSAPLWLADWHAVSIWLILTASFNVDASLTLLARRCRGEVLSSAHRTHLYQRLARHWGSHARVSWALLGVNMAWLLPWAWWVGQQPEWAVGGLVAAYAGLMLGWWRLRGVQMP